MMENPVKKACVDDHANDHAVDHATDHANDHVADHAVDHATDHVTDHANTKLTSRYLDVNFGEGTVESAENSEVPVAALYAKDGVVLRRPPMACPVPEEVNDAPGYKKNTPTCGIRIRYNMLEEMRLRAAAEGHSLPDYMRSLLFEGVERARVWERATLDAYQRGLADGQVQAMRRWACIDCEAVADLDDDAYVIMEAGAEMRCDSCAGKHSLQIEHNLHREDLAVALREEGKQIQEVREKEGEKVQDEQMKMTVEACSDYEVGEKARVDEAQSKREERLRAEADAKVRAHHDQEMARVQEEAHDLKERLQEKVRGEVADERTQREARLEESLVVRESEGKAQVDAVVAEYADAKKVTVDAQMKKNMVGYMNREQKRIKDRLEIEAEKEQRKRERSDESGEKRGDDSPRLSLEQRDALSAKVCDVFGVDPDEEADLSAQVERAPKGEEGGT